MTTTAERPVRLPRVGDQDRMRVQLQLDGHGERAEEVGAWLEAHYAHLHARVSAQPGLCVSVELPSVDSDGFEESWHARLVAAIAPFDLALELVAECFHAVGLEPTGLVSAHLTA